MKHCVAAFRSLSLALLTVSDKRTAANDESGDLLVHLASEAGHVVVQRHLLKTDRYPLCAQVSQWLVDPCINVIVVNGGTGYGPRHHTVTALLPLCETEMTGFGEIFRQLSFEEIGSAGMQSRAFAALANGKVLVAVPGTPSAIELAWTRLIAPQLDARTSPCNWVGLLETPPIPCL